jgi:hypothetical protein
MGRASSSGVQHDEALADNRSVLWRKRWQASRRLGSRISYGIVLPLCSLFTIIVVGTGMPDAINAAQGDGQAGTFVAERRSCEPTRYGGESCSWYGVFEGADGSVQIDDVLLDSDSPEHVGDRVGVLYEGQTDPPVVYLSQGSRDWLWGVLALLASFGYLTWGGWRLFRRLRQQGPKRPSEGSASVVGHD